MFRTRWPSNYPHIKYYLFKANDRSVTIYGAFYHNNPCVHSNFGYLAIPYGRRANYCPIGRERDLGIYLISVHTKSIIIKLKSLFQGLWKY